MPRTKILPPDDGLDLSHEKRQVKIKKLRNEAKALESLDDHVMEALEQLYELMRDDDKYVRLRAVEIILKKVLPEKKIREITGANGEPLKIQNNIDIRAVILNAVETLDSIDLDEIRERSLNGSLKVIGDDSGTEEDS